MTPLVSARIDEGLAANPSASLFAFQYKILADEKFAAGLARRRSNFSLYARDKAIVNGTEGPWRAPLELPSKDWGPIRSSYWDKFDKDSSPEFLLGEIEPFAEFFSASRSSQAFTPTTIEEVPVEKGETKNVT